MSLGDLLRFAAGALAGSRTRSLLSLAGMAIGVAAVVALTALGEGARRYIVDQFASLGSNLLVVLPGKTTTSGLPGIAATTHRLTLEDARALAREVREVTRVVPLVTGTESLAWGDRRRQVAIIGTTRDFLAMRRLTLARGDFLPAGEMQRGEAVAVLGSKAAAELFRGADPLGQVVRVGAWRVRVAGVLAPTGTQLGADMDDMAMVPVATAMQVFDLHSLRRIALDVRTHADLDRVRRRILDVLVARHHEEDVTVLTEDSLLATFSSILGVLTLALGAIAAVSLSVAGIGIMNVMLVSVAERTREVGLLRALGVARRQVLAVFLVEAALLSSAGGLLGLGAGLAAVRVLVAVYPALPAAPPAWAVAAALGLALGVGLLFGLLPARRAAHLDPVAALAGR